MRGRAAGSAVLAASESISTEVYSGSKDHVRAYGTLRGVRLSTSRNGGGSFRLEKLEQESVCPSRRVLFGLFLHV